MAPDVLLSGISFRYVCADIGVSYTFFRSRNNIQSLHREQEKCRREFVTK